MTSSNNLSDSAVAVSINKKPQNDLIFLTKITVHETVWCSIYSINSDAIK